MVKNSNKPLSEEPKSSSNQLKSTSLNPIALTPLEDYCQKLEEIIN